MGEEANTDRKRCVHCGKEISNTYEIFRGQFIRLLHCPHCEKICDEYIEYENTFIFIDLFLLKTEVYRHLLFNHDKSIFKQFIRLFMGSFLLEAYIRFVITKESSSLFIFLMNVIQLIVENIILLGTFIYLIRIFIPDKKEVSIQIVMRSYLVASIGKIFLCLVVMWDFPLSIYLLSLGLSQIMFFESLSVLLEVDVKKVLALGIFINIIFIAIKLLFFPYTPLTHLIINNQFSNLFN